MVTASTKKELEEAIKKGETEIKIEGKKFQASCYLAAKYQSFKNATKHIFMDLILSPKIVIEQPEVWISLTVIICLTAIGIIAMLNKYDVEIDYKKGKIKVKKRS